MDNFISVIIPTYKGNDSIGIALNSLVNQTYKNFEVIVSDDNGVNSSYQKATESIVKKYKDLLRIIYLANEHKNGSHARNEGIKIAKGDIICFLDDDDFYMPEYFESINKASNEYPTKDIFFFDVAIITKEGNIRKVTNDKINYKELIYMKKEVGTGSNLCIRKKVFDDEFLFDERYSRFQDLEFIIKKLSKFESLWINKEMIVKYYNQTDNYLNYEKYLTMQDLFITDLYKHGLINKNEIKEVENIMQHSLFNDMLIKNAENNDMSNIYNVLKENNNINLIDLIMYKLYLTSHELFNFAIKIVLRNKKNAINNVDLKTINNYKRLLNEELA